MNVYLYQNNTEKILKNDYIGEYWWAPWANTLAYYPLTATTTTQDKSWNWKNMTNVNSVSFWTYWWVSCGSFSLTSSTYLLLDETLWWWAHAFTVSIRLYRANNDSKIIFWSAGSWSQNYWIQLYTVNWVITYNWYSSSPVTTSTTIPSASWHNVIVTYNWTTIKVYMDWNTTPISSTNKTLNIANVRTVIWWDVNTSSYSRWDWYLSEAIFENKEWTTSEISDYYNQTKSNYWL